MAEIFSKEDDVLSSKEVMKSLMCLVRNYVRHINKPKPGLSQAIIKDKFAASAILANMVNAISIDKKEFSYFGITASKVMDLSFKKNNPFGSAACKVNLNSWADVFKDWTSSFKNGMGGMSDDLCKNINAFEGNPELNKNSEFRAKWLLKEDYFKEGLSVAKKDGEQGIKKFSNDAVMSVLNDFVSVSEERMEIEGMPRFEMPTSLKKSTQNDVALAGWMTGELAQNKTLSVSERNVFEAQAF